MSVSPKSVEGVQKPPRLLRLGASEALCKQFPFGVVSSLFCFFSALKKQNGRRTGWRTAPWRPSIQWAFANARLHF
jgi:hypothetical protein